MPIKKNTLFIQAFILLAGISSLLLIKAAMLLHSSNYRGFNAITQNISKHAVADVHSLIPVASNQWYSNIYSNFPTQPLFAMPLAYKISQQGLSFSYPDVVKTPETIFGSYKEDFTVGTGQSFSKPQITQIGDWHIRLRMQASNGDELSFFLAHGVPYTIIHAKATNLVITCTRTPEILSSTADSIVLQINNHAYLFATQQAKLQVSNTTLMVEPTEALFIALLDDPSHADLFRKRGGNDITNTSVAFHSTSTTLVTTYTVQTTNGQTLIALYPHQYDTLGTRLQRLGTYTTIRGPLTLVQTQSFTTDIPLTIPPVGFTSLSSVPSDVTQQVTTDVDAYIAAGQSTSKDYFFGTWLGKGITLLQLADTLSRTPYQNDTGLVREKTRMLAFLEPIFIESMNNFAYQKSTTSLVATAPEFGNEKNNDHHFHYGYYLRAAAILALYDRTIIAKVKDTIGQMARDIANADKAATDYPYLRGFDVYESHSWADGFANFGDGNNQESSSEAINAWYGVYLWGKITGDTSLANTGLVLYNQEILGAKYYWFDIKNLYTPPYKHAISTVVWGGKIDFATWFSPEANMKYGIELLPFTPASDYLGTLPGFSKYDADFTNAKGDRQKPWGDLFVLWESLYDPAKARQEAPLVKKPEDNTSQSLFLYMLYRH